jgi:hypothetical protein
MEDLRNLQQAYKRGFRGTYVLMMAGALLFASDWGIHAWLFGLGLVLYTTTWQGTAKLSLEVIERLDILRANEQP